MLEKSQNMFLNNLKNKGLLISIICLLAFQGFSQQKQTIPGSFSLIGVNDQEKKAFYTSSIEKADMEQFRLKETDVVLKFKEGFECILFSAKSLASKGIDADHYSTSFGPNYTLPVFSVHSNGFLTAEFETKAKFSSH